MKKKINDFVGKIERHPFLYPALASAVSGILFTIILAIPHLDASVFIIGIGLGCMLIYPFVLTLIQLLLIYGVKEDDRYRYGKLYDIITIVLGTVYSLIYMDFIEVKWNADWQTTLINNQSHAPIQAESALTLLVILIVGSIGYLRLTYGELDQKAPLATVIDMSAMYLSTAVAIAWAIQTFTRRGLLEPLLTLLPINCVFITVKTIRRKVYEWKRLGEDSEINLGKLPWIQTCNRLLTNANRWPVAAFVIMWPLLGILIAVLLLFGQEPTAVIKAFTETSDWSLSRRVAPQNLIVDEHYLCTVAAGGHDRVVKPKRMGIRHGHDVIVNRQLCIANAFEQILEEKTPRFHRVVRNFYDKYGFPVAKLIRHKWSADVIYFIMKPLEWIFWVVLYLTEVNPENRIALQYTGKNLKDFR